MITKLSKLNLSKMLKEKKAFVFDLDGTLIDSMRIWDKIDTKVIEYFGGIVYGNLTAMRCMIIEKYKESNTYYEWARYMQAAFLLRGTVDDIYNFRNAIMMRILENEVTLKPGVAEFLKLLKSCGKKLAIVTLASNKILDIYLNKNQNIIGPCNLREIFGNHIITADMIKYKKPYPEGYIKAMELLSSKPSETIVFEDALNGVLAAKAAKIDIIAIREEAVVNEADEIMKNVIAYAADFHELVNLMENV